MTSLSKNARVAGFLYIVASVVGSHGSPVAAPQVVQRNEFICFTVSSLAFIQSLSFPAQTIGTGVTETRTY